VTARGGAAAAGRGLRAVLDRMRRRNDVRRTARLLMRMDPHILSDIGVNRGDVFDLLRDGRR
jgi:uncharacterized protein YjiS (DUF1127 family)